jgi:hypothetical protein
MNGIQPRSKRLRFETLESKVLLAADLHAAVVGGDLVLVGSKGDDVLLIEGSTDSAGTWTITPANNDSINGNSPGQSVTLSGVVDDIRVSLRDGNDKLTIKGTHSGNHVPGSLSIRGSHGTNQILVQSLTVGNDLSIRTRGAADEIAVKTTEVNDELVIRSAAGADSVECHNLTVGASLDVHTGGGWFDDAMSITDTVIGDDFYFRSSRGDNELIVGFTDIGDRTQVRLGNGNDRVQLGYSSPGRLIFGPSLSPDDTTKPMRMQQLQIQTNGGKDDIDIHDAVVSRHMRAYLGDDADQMTIMESTIGGNSIVYGSTGDDLLEAGTSYGGELLSAGHHGGTVYLTSPWPFAGDTSFDGGEGEDTIRYEQDSNVDQDDRQWKNWEHVFDNHFGSAPIAASPADTPADAVNAFAADLYHQLADSQENLAFSPLSISAALPISKAWSTRITTGSCTSRTCDTRRFLSSTKPVRPPPPRRLSSLASSRRFPRSPSISTPIIHFSTSSATPKPTRSCSWGTSVAPRSQSDEADSRES